MPFLHFDNDCHSVNLPSLYPDTHVSTKVNKIKNKKRIAVEEVGGEGLQLSVLREKSWQQNTNNFS